MRPTDPNVRFSVLILDAANCPWLPYDFPEGFILNIIKWDEDEYDLDDVDGSHGTWAEAWSSVLTMIDRERRTPLKRYP